MAVNSDKPQRWKADVAQSVDLYNDWFINFAPSAYRRIRIATTTQVEFALTCTNNMADIGPQVLRTNPSVLPMLRMATAPPIARDRLIGLAGVLPNLVKAMEEDHRLPPQMKPDLLDDGLRRIGAMILCLVDKDIFTWLEDGHVPTQEETHRAATIVADRLCGAVADPFVRNAQEKRQLDMIGAWLRNKGYSQMTSADRLKYDKMQPGTFAFRLNVPVRLVDGNKTVNIPIDVAIMPMTSNPGEFPLLIEAKSAGDFTNTNKRRKEEAMKIAQLRSTYGAHVRFVLFLCGYFDSGYLGYEAAEGIDWIWEHRIDDLAELGV